VTGVQTCALQIYSINNNNNNNNNNNLYLDSSIITAKTVDFNRPEKVLIDRENKTALIPDTAVPSTHKLPKN
jgi:hypothetical protein